MRKAFLAAAVTLVAAVLVAASWKAQDPEGLRPAGRAPALYPDYTGTIIPANIAPLNMIVRERGSSYRLRLSAPRGRAITVASGDGRMRIPEGRWRGLLEANIGGELALDVAVKGEDGWRSFDTQRIVIADEPVDPYVVYRHITPLYNLWNDMSLDQRDLRSFDERIILHNRISRDPSGRSTGDVCFNCHTFLGNDPRRMVLHIRAGSGPTMLLAENGRAVLVDTRIGKMPPAAYITWHPSGEFVTFSRNGLYQIFHAAGTEVRDVLDRDSNLGIYRIAENEALAPPAISRPDRLETLPCWSPDGRYLYFCSAPLLWAAGKNIPEETQPKVRYDLVRIPYDLGTGAWGEVETVVSAAEFGRSASLPQISPDGRWLVFCGHEYGSFPIFQPSSDLYLLDLHAVPPTGSPAGGRPAPEAIGVVNSEQCDSYHSWSSNGRWIIFSSKREDGVYARLYLSHVDEQGRFGKPFPMPQKDPDIHARTLITYNRPEFAIGPVSISSEELARAINAPPLKQPEPPAAAAAPAAPAESMWQAAPASPGPGTR